MNIIALGYSSAVFKKDSVDRTRLLECAKQVNALHMVVFSRDTSLQPFQDDRLFVYPATSQVRVVAFLKALRIVFKIRRQEAAGDAPWVVTTQDPFETAIIGWILSRCTKTNFNIQEHGDFFSHAYFGKESLLNRLRIIVGHYVLRRADTVRAVDERIKHTLVGCGVSKERIRVLPVAVDLKMFLQQPIPRQNSDKIKIVTVARFVSQKNLSLLLRAFAHVHKIVPQTHLVIVGRGPEEHGLRKLAKELFGDTSTMVTFLPWTDDVPRLLASCHVYALSSWYEGYARVLPEAMAAGLPIITTDVGCAGSIVRNNEHGFVVPVGDETAFTGALITITGSQQLREQYGNAGRAFVLKYHSAIETYAVDFVRTLV